MGFKSFVETTNISVKNTTFPHMASPDPCQLRIFQRFRLVKIIKKIETRVKIIKVEEIIASYKHVI